LFCGERVFQEYDAGVKIKRAYMAVKNQRNKKYKVRGEEIIFIGWQY
jgi:hypothetical protein